MAGWRASSRRLPVKSSPVGRRERTDNELETPMQAGEEELPECNGMPAHRKTGERLGTKLSKPRIPPRPENTAAERCPAKHEGDRTIRRSIYMGT